MDTMDELKAEMSYRAKGMELDVQVQPYGVLQCGVAVLTDEPTTREVEAGMPHVGGVGNLVWSALKRAKLNRHDVYSTICVKRRTGGYDYGQAVTKMDKHELARWQELLRWEISQLPEGTLLLCCGDYAWQAISGEPSSMKWRGSVIDVTVAGKKFQALCTLSPKVVLRDPSLEIMFRFDANKLDRVLQGKWKKHEILTHINPTPAQAIEYMDMLEATPSIPISYDIETTSGETACVGFANQAHEAMCINFRTRGTNRWNISDEIEVRLRMQELFNNRELKFVAQNGMYDMTWMWMKDRILLPRLHFDTMLAHHALYSTLPHNLGFLTTQYTDHPYYKDDKKVWREGGDIDTFWRYNGTDCALTWDIAQKLERELKRESLDTFFFEHVMRLQRHLVDMCVLGVAVDTTLLHEIGIDMEADLSQRVRQWHKDVQHATGESDLFPNPNSPKQLQELFFDKLKLVGRGRSTNKENCENMLQHRGTSDVAANVVAGLLAYKSEHKFFSTYVNINLDPDCRMRSQYNQTGTQSAPGRLSSSSNGWGTGSNMQNQPERAHRQFVADDGYGFGYFDFSQAEARIVAYLSGCEALKANFEAAAGGLDVHRLNAARIFKCEYDDIPKEDRLEDGSITKRYLGKRCVHGLNYRMQAPRLAQACGIGITQAKQAWWSYHNAFPEIQKWWKNTEDTVRRTKMLISPMGRRLVVLERLTDKAMESIVAFAPQSTVGDKTCQTMYLIHEDPEWPADARIVINVHDSLTFLAPVEKLKTCMAIAKKHALWPINVRGEPVTIPIDCKISYADDRGVHRWNQLEKIEVEAAR